MNIILRPGSIRPSQIITTFGPGAIYDNLMDSFLILGIDHWDKRNLRKVDDTALLMYLRNSSSYFNKLKYFMIPVASDLTDKQIPVKTFPTWGVCPKCKMLQRRDGKTKGGRQCKSQECTSQSVVESPITRPVRFIMACENGHLDDFPWYEWVHRDSSANCSREESQLYLTEDQNVSSLESLIVECRNQRCRQRKNMGPALAADGLKWVLIGGCGGKTPWLEHDDTACDATPKGLLKGGSNVYFSIPMRSVTVPPFSDELSQQITEMWDAMSRIKDEIRLLENIKDWFPSYPPEVVMEKFKRHKEVRSSTEKPDMLLAEFKELNSGYPVDTVDFKTELVKDIPENYTEEIDKLILVRRLRELIVLIGFTRINPPSNNDASTGFVPISRSIPEWLPAVENRGEGVFLSLKENRFKRWLTGADVQTRFKQITHNKSHRLSSAILAGSVERASARYVFLHSFAHLLIRELSNFAGYSASSIRERIYSGDDMAGILFYTSSSSSDGSLGGLVEQGHRNFGLIMQKAIGRSRICSSDPLCAVLKPGSGHRNNGSACHACLFLPETSCECMNDLLDRTLVHSTISSEIGFFGMDGA